MRRDTHHGSAAFREDEAKSGKLLQHAIAEPQHRESIETQARFARRTWPGCSARIYPRTVRADGVSFELLVLIVRAKPEEPMKCPRCGQHVVSSVSHTCIPCSSTGPEPVVVPLGDVDALEAENGIITDWDDVELRPIEPRADDGQ